jgi:diguanylate cyclase (GGDEF)-like protein/PAS domain S-box-containing protein
MDAVEAPPGLGSGEMLWPSASQILELMPDGIVLSDREGKIVFANRQAEQMTGYTREELGRERIEILVPPRLRAIHKEHRQASYASHKGPRPMGTADHDFRARRKDGSEFSADIALGPIDTPSGRHVVAVIRDITKRRQLESTLEHMALHDPLTGLANRTLFFDRLRQALLAAERDRKHVALVMMDIDYFKAINDAYGHLVGDQVLRKLALRLTFPLRASDTIARIGGDEFAWILPRVASRDSAARIVRKLLHTNIENLVVGPQLIKVFVSTGLALYPDDGEDTDVLIRKADLALYAAKRKMHAYRLAATPIGLSAGKRSRRQPALGPTRVGLTSGARGVSTIDNRK